MVAEVVEVMVVVVVTGLQGCGGCGTMQHSTGAITMTQAGMRAGGKFSMGNTKRQKLDGEQVMQIREKYASGLYTMNMLAVEYHVTRNTISDIVHGVTWQNIPGVVPQHVMNDAALQSMRKLNELMEDKLPAAEADTGLDTATLEAMERAVQSIPQPEFLKPAGDTAARMAVYLGKPAIQAQSADECPPALGDVGGRSATVSSCQTPKCRYDAEHSGACKSEQGIYLDSRQATPGQNSSELLDQTTEEAGK